MTSRIALLGILYGAGLGAFYFGGLWLTVRRLHRLARPNRFLLLSFCFRLTVLLAGLWLALRYDPVLFAVTLGGFFLTRFVMVRVVGRPLQGERHATQS